MMPGSWLCYDVNIFEPHIREKEWETIITGECIAPSMAGKKPLKDRVTEVSIRISSEADLYNPLDPTGEKLSDDVVSYIVNELSIKGVEKKSKLTIICGSKVDEDKVRASVVKAVNDNITVIDREKRTNTLNQFRLILIGVIVISFWLTISAVIKDLWVEILSIIGSFAIWEASNIWIVENPKLKAKRRISASLKEADIVFVYE